MNDKIINKLIKLSDKSLRKNEFPVSAIIYSNGRIIATGYNKRNRTNLTIDHAEIIAIRKANKKLHRWRLTNTCMVTTLEPCPMCMSVIREARIDKVYYMVPRNPNKKQYKCTVCLPLEIDDDRVTKYVSDLNTFFTNKR